MTWQTDNVSINKRRSTCVLTKRYCLYYIYRHLVLVCFYRAVLLQNILLSTPKNPGVDLLNNASVALFSSYWLPFNVSSLPDPPNQCHHPSRRPTRSSLP